MPIDFAHAKNQLYAAVLADVLDDMGHPDQVMDARLRPLQPESVVLGRARTSLVVPQFAVPAQPYEMQIDAIDSLQPGDLPVFHMSGITACACWGELYSTAARARGAVGVVTDGYGRDARKVMEMGFPMFAAGTRPTNSKGRSTLAGFDLPIRCGGVRVQPGDLVFAEIDGIVVIPAAIADEVIGRAIDIASRENVMRSALQAGSTLRAAWETHHVM
jgi:regulator of RNase E activity RraA